jgi:hypothetical protein
MFHLVLENVYISYFYPHLLDGYSYMMDTKPGEKPQISLKRQKKMKIKGSLANHGDPKGVL